MKLVLITPNKKHDYTTELIIEGLKQHNCNLVATDVGNGITKDFSDIEIIEEAKSADLAIAFFGKVRDNKPPKHYLFEKLLEKNKRAFVDGSEWTSTGYPEYNQVSNSLKNPDLRRGNDWINHHMLNISQFYYKRETYQQDLNLGIIPLPFGLMNRHLQHNVNKDIDIFCVFGHQNTGLRKETMDYCNFLKLKSDYNIVVGSKYPKEQYMSLLSRSKIIIDAWGGGDNCDRFYEGIGARACCLYQKYKTIVPNSFVDFTHAVSYENMDEFIQRLHMLLENENLTNQIAIDGLNHAIKYHSSYARAHNILEKFIF